MCHSEVIIADRVLVPQLKFDLFFLTPFKDVKFEELFPLGIFTSILTINQIMPVGLHYMLLLHDTVQHSHTVGGAAAATWLKH